MHTFGLIGYPLSHSFSPAYFNKKFSDEGLSDHLYEAYPIESINKLSELLDSNSSIRGLNVTIPYKKQVIPFLHTYTDAVRKMNACNCIKIEKGQLSGHNTDVIGFERSLEPYLAPHHQKALVLGTGGSAAAVEFVLDKLAIELLYVSREKKNIHNSITYQELTKELIEEYTLIINTTPLGMYPQVDNCPEIPYNYITPSHYLFDLVYNPAETLFLKKGAEKGALVKNGADMLIIQAEESWKIWNSSL